MKNAVFWDVAPCRSCVNRCFGRTYRLHLQGRKIRERGTSMSRWLAVLWAIECTVNLPIPISILTLGPTTTHSVSKLHFPHWCTGLELYAIKTACMRSWCSWGTFSGRTVTTTGRSTESSTVVRISVNPTTIQTQSPSCPISGLYWTELAECSPDTTSSQWACLPRKYLVSSGRSKSYRVYTESPVSVARSTLGIQAVPWTQG
jgi:hypothetical protein